METHAAGLMARRMMNEHGLGHWLFKFDRRAVGRLGCCRHGEQTISLSEKIVRLTDESVIRNTVLHEIAHALVGPGHGHDHVWRRQALAIGCNGNRGHTVDTSSLAPWLATCQCAGKKFRRHRLAANIRNCSACPDCKTKLEWQKVA